MGTRCKVCRRKFLPHRKGQRYCSPACSRRAEYRRFRARGGLFLLRKRYMERELQAIG
jgi:uncharacterized OB-fold protein